MLIASDGMTGGSGGTKTMAKTSCFACAAIDKSKFYSDNISVTLHFRGITANAVTILHCLLDVQERACKPHLRTHLELVIKLNLAFQDYERHGWSI